jgi:acyl-CoA reductase-like NAD-dependent aldehyde dehydrogenase
MPPDDLAAHVAAELLEILGLVRNGVDDAALSARGAFKTQEMLSEQARIIERVVESLRRRADELHALQSELEAAGSADAASAVARIASDFRAAYATAAGPMRRWVLANESGAESLKIIRTKMNSAMQGVLEAADVTRLLAQAVETPERPSAASHSHQ